MFPFNKLLFLSELTEESTNCRKYVKWRAAYIHNFLKNGETTVPSPIGDENGENEAVAGNHDENTTPVGEYQSTQNPALKALAGDSKKPYSSRL